MPIVALVKVRIDVILAAVAILALLNIFYSVLNRIYAESTVCSYDIPSSSHATSLSYRASVCPP